MIIADVHEPEKWREIGDKIKDLGADFVIVGEDAKFVIERKTLSDLMHSIKQRRFWAQLDRLLEWQEKGYKPICLIHGSIHKRMNARYAKCSLPQWVGIKVAIMMKGIDIYYAINQTEALMFVKKLDEKAGEMHEEWQMPSVCKKVGRSLEQESIDVLLSFNGIGYKTAKKLIKSFRNLHNIFTASERELVRVLGQKKAEHVYEVLIYSGEKK